MLKVLQPNLDSFTQTIGLMHGLKSQPEGVRLGHVDLLSGHLLLVALSQELPQGSQVVYGDGPWRPKQQRESVQLVLSHDLTQGNSKKLLSCTVSFFESVILVKDFHLVREKILEELKTVIGSPNLEVEGHGAEQFQNRDIPQRLVEYVQGRVLT